MNNYELTVLVDPKLDDKAKEELNEDIKKYVGTSGTIENSTDWGRKQLAYPIKKNEVGVYLHLKLQSKETDFVKDLNKKLRVEKKLLRYLIVKSGA